MLTRNQPLFGVQQRRTIFKVTWVFLENLDWSGVFLESNQQKPFLATGDVAQVSDRVARAFNQTSYLAKRLHQHTLDQFHIIRKRVNPDILHLEFNVFCLFSWGNVFTPSNYTFTITLRNFSTSSWVVFYTPLYFLCNFLCNFNHKRVAHALSLYNFTQTKKYFTVALLVTNIMSAFIH